MGPFSSPRSLTQLNSPDNQWSPSISGDDLTLYWASNRSGGKGGYDIWTASRPSVTAEFGAPTNLGEVNTSDDEAEPAISADGRELYVYRSSDTSAALLRATRAGPAARFSIPAPLPIFGSSFLDASGPWLSGDGLHLYFSGHLSDKAPDDLALARRATTGDAFTFVRLLSEVNGPATDGWPTLSPDERELFFESDRGGAGWQIYSARRDSSTALFSSPTPSTELNGNLSCGDPDLSRDGRTIYFALSVGTDRNDLWTASRECQ